MKSYFLEKKWLYRAVLLLVVAVVAAGVIELNGLVREIKAGKTAMENNTLAPQQVQDRAGRVQSDGQPTDGAEPGIRTGSGGKSAKSEFFVEYRLGRDRTRSQRVDLLREIMNNQNSSPDTRKEANRELMSIFQTMEKETELENLIRAEGFKDAIVYLQDKEKTVTVTLQANILTDIDRHKLNSLITRVTGLKKENIEFICKS